MDKMKKFHYQKKEFQKSSAIHITWELWKMLLKSVPAPRWQQANQKPLAEDFAFFP